MVVVRGEQRTRPRALARLRTPSLSYTWDRWVLTVSAPMRSSRPTSLLVRPDATRRTTFISVAVRLSHPVVGRLRLLGPAARRRQRPPRRGCGRRRTRRRIRRRRSQPEPRRGRLQQLGFVGPAEHVTHLVAQRLRGAREAHSMYEPCRRRALRVPRCVHDLRAEAASVMRDEGGVAELFGGRGSPSRRVSTVSIRGEWRQPPPPRRCRARLGARQAPRRTGPASPTRRARTFPRPAFRRARRATLPSRR